MSDFSVVLLAGGRSARLGFDKQLLPTREELLLDRLIRDFQAVSEDIVVVSNRPELHRHRPVRVVTDVLPGGGPLSGIHAGLLAIRKETAFVAACDMPWLRTDYAGHLMARFAQAPGAEAAVTRCGTMLEPLSALYAKALLPRLEQQLRAGVFQISRLLRASQTLYIPESEARRYSPDWRMFMNINTPEAPANAPAGRRAPPCCGR